MSLYISERHEYVGTRLLLVRMVECGSSKNDLFLWIQKYWVFVASDVVQRKCSVSLNDLLITLICLKAEDAL